jgi:uncharacterized protein (TIGR03435 family)
MTATMVDLIRTAYGVDAQNVIGGPNWLEFDRFDVIAKAPAAASPETLKLMLQALLADRFGLTTHPDNQPLPGFVLTLGKRKLQLKDLRRPRRKWLPFPTDPSSAWRHRWTSRGDLS